MRSLLASFVLVLGVCALPGLAHAQQQNGTLTVTVVDTTGAVIPGATVSVVGIEATTKAASLEPVQTSERGIAIVPRLLPGRYSVKAEFQGFETRTIPDVRVRNGDNKQVVMLPIEGVKQAVVVEQNREQAASDPRGPSFGTTLTREQLEALSDDPEVLRQQLQEMAGPGAVFKIDSFEGGALPPKAQIRSIRISRDQFAAEYHSAGGTQIEIITQPGLGPVRYNAGYRMRSDPLTGRSPFTPVRGPESFRTLFLGANGTLVPNKSSFGIFFNGTNSFDTPNINVALSGGQIRSEALDIQTPRDNFGINANVDYAITLNQTLRFGLNVFHNDNENLGVGAYDEEERAYSTEGTNGAVRAQQIGPLGRRGFLRTRVQYSWNDTDAVSSLEARTIRVNDAFNSGGAQIRGGQHSKTIVVGADLDYVRGLHTVRSGVQIDWLRAHADDFTNYLGTYTFESLEAYDAGTPRSYTRRLGDPNVKYQTFQGAIYLQDDIRVRRNLTLSAGMRYEAQSHVHDLNNIAPRFGVTWAPFSGGQTTLRASWGLFYDWLSSSTYEQTLRFDGFHQLELDIINPPYPDPLDGTGTIPTTNRYLLGEAFALPTSNRFSLGIDQRLTRFLQSSATYAYTRGSSLARGLNLNPPLNGARPDPRFNNIVDVVSDANSRLHQLQFNLTANPGALLPIAKRRERTAGQPETDHGVFQLHARVASQQHRRRVQPRAARHPGARVGSGRQ
jgi:hypothetical protein